MAHDIPVAGPDSYVIHAEVGPAFLSKADRLFRNDDLGVFDELLQNSRRAGATLVKVTIDEQEGDSASCTVTLEDNGTGIEDFRKLLLLSDSGWNDETQANEDPAGMGFYSLALSGVEVFSRHRYANIRPEAFTGREQVVVETRPEFLQGTRLRFKRSSSKNAITHAVTQASEFYPVDVHLNGELLPRVDFLEGAFYREVIDGIEIGFAASFTHDRHRDGHDLNWNFYGLCLYKEFASIRGIIPPPDYRGYHDVLDLEARFNVIETGRLKLQLPDRRSVIQSDFLKEFKVKARAAAYRAIQKLPGHLLSFEDWKEAQALGVELPEAIQRLDTWRALGHSSDVHQMFGEDEVLTLCNTGRVLLIEDEFEHRHTLQGALHSGAKLDFDLFRTNHRFRGYRWYDALPRMAKIGVRFDDQLVDAKVFEGNRKRPSTITVQLAIARPGQESETLNLPALVHVDSDNFDPSNFVAVKDSPWEGGQSGPFSIEEFIIYSTFSPSDDGDTFDTQLSEFEDDVKHNTLRYFCEPKARLFTLIQDGLGLHIRFLAKQLGVTEIRLAHERDEIWKIEVTGKDGPLLSNASGAVTP